jgi:hypothetical protein
MNTFMKPAKKTTRKPAAVKPETRNIKVNVEYLEQIADEAIATVMALRALVVQLANQLEARK